MDSPFPAKSVDFLSWQRTKTLEPLKDGEGVNESACSRLLDEFFKLLRWYCQPHRGTLDSIAASQALCYTDTLLEVFADPSIYVQLQAAKLLQTNRMRVMRYVMKISPSALETDTDMTSEKMFTSCILLLQCFMLNCMSVLPVSIWSPESQHLFLSLLYKNLESIPHLENPQHMVKLITIQSVLNSIYCQLKSVKSVQCIPSQRCIGAIVKVASYPIQMLKILAKAVLSLLSPHLTEDPKKSLFLHVVEIQTFINCLQGRPSLNKAMILPISNFMEDLIMASNDNKVAFMQWNTPMFITMSKEKQEDPVVLDMFDELISKLTKSEQESTVKDNIVNSSVVGAMYIECDDDAKYMDQGYTKEFEHLSHDSFRYFDIFNCLMKHFLVYVQDILATSAELTPSIINGITTIMGFMRDMMTLDEEICSNICASIVENSQFLSLIYQIVQKWPELMDCFPLLGNALYGLLMSGSNNDKFCFELGRSGLLYWMLSFLNSATEVDMFQFGDIGNIIAPLVIIFNCAQRPQVIPALEMVSTVNILPVYAQCPDVRIGMLAKFVLSFMDFALFDYHLLDLKDEEIKYISDQLTESAANGSTSHWYTDTELLLVLTNLTKSPYFERNISHILRGKTSIIDSAVKLMQSSKTEVQKASLKFLLNFYSFSEKPAFKVQIHGESASKVQETLDKLSSSDNTDIRELVSCCQLLINRDISESPDDSKILRSCYKANLYDKCAKLCTSSYIASKLEICLLKAKALFHMYRREQEYLHRHLSSLSQGDAQQKTTSCYAKVEECIKLLSKVLDNQMIDYEGSKMLDQCLLDYVKETNKLNKLKRCLLCRTRCELKRSHLWPRSFLRRYGSSQAQNSSCKIFISFTSEKPRQKSAGELTYWMLCSECEQILSQNGEDKFSKEMFDVICSTSDIKDANVPYGPWLYNFSIGLLFRTFLFFDLTSDESYSIFLKCREHLLSLPVKHEKKCESSSAGMYMHMDYQQAKDTVSVGQEEAKELRSEQYSKLSPELATLSMHTVPTEEAENNSKIKGHIPFFILINPTKLDVDHSRKSMLIRALFDAGSTMMSGVSLSSGKRDLSGLHHFIVIRLGNINILLQLNASTDYCPPPDSVVWPDGGKLFVPAERRRWDYIPEGLWVQIDKMANIIEEATLRHYAYKSKAGNWKASDSPEMQQLPSGSEEFSEQERILHRRLKESSDTPQSGFISRFLKISQPSLSFLPDEIKIAQKHSYTQKSYLQLPDSHIIFCHATFTLMEAAMTIFLAANFEEASQTLKTYVIIVERVQGVQLAYGAYVDAHTNPLKVTESLVDMNKFSDHHQARFHHYCKVMEDIFPAFLEVNKFDNLDMIIQRARCTRLKQALMSLGSLDFKCKDGCWYCEDSCHHCLQPAGLGYSLRTQKGQILKFCKANPCYLFYVPLPERPPAFIIPLPHASLDSDLLIQITKVISTGWSNKTVAVIHLCISNCLPGAGEGQLYALTQFRTGGSHTFFDFLISDNYEPLDTMWYMTHKLSVIMRYRALFMLMIKMITEDALQATPYQTLQDLLDAHHMAVQTEAKKEQLQPGTDKLGQDAFTDDISCLFQEDEAAK